jgi:hypothetical protein
LSGAGAAIEIWPPGDDLAAQPRGTGDRIFIG